MISHIKIIFTVVYNIIMYVYTTANRDSRTLGRPNIVLERAISFVQRFKKRLYGYSSRITIDIQC